LGLERLFPYIIRYDAALQSSFLDERIRKMPTMRKLSEQEVQTLENKGKGQRRLVEEQYDAFLADYGPGDYGEAELDEGENRLTVRNRFKAAAARRELNLTFQRTTGNLLRFQIALGASGAPSRSRGGRRRATAPAG
jgi:hypothetical protein